MASKRTPNKVKRLKRKGKTVTFDGNTYRVNGLKLDRYNPKAER